MYTELLIAKVNWWNNVIVELDNDKKNIITIKWIENNSLLSEQDLEANLVYANRECIYQIRLETKTELFIKKEAIIRKVASRTGGFEYVSKQIVEDLLLMGLSHSIESIREMHLRYPEQFPYGRFAGG